MPFEARHCLYLVPAGSVTPRPIFHSSGGRALRGPVWAPNGRSIAVAAKVGAGFQVLQLSPTGRIVRRLVGRDFAFTREGALVFQRGDRLLVLEGGRIRRLASKAELAAAAGFPASFWGGLRGAQGYGRGGVAIQWWGERRSVLLLVSRRGVVSPATPVFRAGAYMPGYASWSPDGRVLLIPWQRVGHIHCLARWTALRGYRSIFCRNPHFDTIVWHPDGGTAILDDSRIVGRDGGVRARVGKLGRALGVRWLSG